MARFVYPRPIYAWPLDAFVRACLRLPDETQWFALRVFVGIVLVVFAVAITVHYWMFVLPALVALGLLWKFALPRLESLYDKWS